MKTLIDFDGENQAVRGFLLGLEAGFKTHEGMRAHLMRYGCPYWPADFANATGHIPKFAQQAWLRHLFAMESSDAHKEQP